MASGATVMKSDSPISASPEPHPPQRSARVQDKFKGIVGFSPFFAAKCLGARHLPSMIDPFPAKRAALLQQMGALDSMELGSLKAEFRSTPSGSKSGPYFKHQVWKDGANLSQRVASEDAPALQAAIDNRLRFESLAQAVIELTVEHTRQNDFSDSLKKKTSRPSSPKKRRSRT